MRDSADSRGGAREPASDAEVRELTAAITRGDTDAFGVFYEKWFDRAFALTRKFTRRDEATCLDMVQECMLRVIRSLRAMPNEEALARWMVRAIRTTALDHLRQESRRIHREQRALEAQSTVAPVSSQDLELEERLDWLAARIHELSAEEKALLNARFRDGKTLSASGEAVGLSGHAARGRIHRVVLRLRALAKDMFHE